MQMISDVETARLVLNDQNFVVPAVPPASHGIAWLRASVGRFSRGSDHQRRRALAVSILDGVPLDAMRSAAGDHPVATLARAMGTACGSQHIDGPIVDLVREAAQAYQPGSGDDARADAAVDRLVAILGGAFDEPTAARIGLLVQACDATATLIERARQRPVSEVLRENPPVLAIKREALSAVTVGGVEIEAGEVVRVALGGGLAFGAGPRQCPGRTHALALVTFALAADNAVRDADPDAVDIGHAVRDADPDAVETGHATRGRGSEVAGRECEVREGGAVDGGAALPRAHAVASAVHTSAADVSAFAALHRPGDPLVLPNVWDVASARALVRAGFAALGTTSLGVAAASGLPDGEGAVDVETLTLTQRLVGLGAHVSIDLETGSVAIAAAVAAAGAVGINVEDAMGSSVAHAALIRAVKREVPTIFVNARTDTHWLRTGDIADTLRRVRLYADAGADGVFVPGLVDPAEIEAVVAAVDIPVNVLFMPGQHTVTTLRDLGVARISMGSLLFRAALGASVEVACAVRDGGEVPAGLPTYAEVNT